MFLLTGLKCISYLRQHIGQPATSGTISASNFIHKKETDYNFCIGGTCRRAADDNFCRCGICSRYGDIWTFANRKVLRDVLNLSKQERLKNVWKKCATCLVVSRRSLKDKMAVSFSIAARR